MKKLLILALLNMQCLFACTSFFISDSEHKIFAKNLDWLTGIGQLVKNDQGKSKVALMSNGDQPVSWVSKYGSVTFNQYGVEFPLGGMNQKGLVVEVLWLDNAEYLPRDSRLCINELQWVQYHLDMSSSVEEVISSLKSLRISDTHSKVHFMIADKKGDYASLEYVNGKEIIARKMAYPILANNLYDDEVKYLNKHEGYGGVKKAKQTGFSRDRFVATCNSLKNIPSKGVKDFAFKTLKGVSSSSTVWSIVYDMNSLTVYFKTEDNLNERQISLQDLNFKCENQVMAYDLAANQSGIIKLEARTGIQNEQLIDEAVDEVEFLADIPDAYIDKVKKYPARVKCK